MASSTSPTSTARRRGRQTWERNLDIGIGDTGPSLATSFAASRTPSPYAVKTTAEPAAQASVAEKSDQTRKTRRSRTPRWKRYIAKHTWVVPLAILSIFAAIYAVNPSESNPVHRFIFLSYKQGRPSGRPDEPTQYGKGLWDIALVFFYTVFLSFTREFTMQQLLLPLAHLWGIKSRSKRLRFMEQMYTAIYFSITGPFGIYVMRHGTSPSLWYFDTRAMYEGYPHQEQSAELKFYYLFQAAYWAQQALVMVLGLEKPRKDFKELMVHHVVTLALIGLSYRFHFTHMGVAVYITHDFSDLLLALSKSLNYTNSRFVGPFFAVTVLTWIYLRHYLNLCIMVSLLGEFRTVGPYELDWEKGEYKCWISNAITFVLLAALQLLNVFWLGLLLRTAYRLVVLKIAKDDRSDDEE